MGECTRAALRTPVVALTHGHADHLSGLPMYLGVRRLYGMADPLIITPPDTVAGVRAFIDALGSLQGRPFEARVVAAPAVGESFDLENDILIRTFQVDHYPEEDGPGKACGYVICRRVRHLRPEFVGLPGAQIAALKEKRPDIMWDEEIPLAAVSGDTTPKWIEQAGDQVLSARVLFQECTFLGQGRTTEAARKGLHSHIDDLHGLLGRVKSRAIVLYHISQYYQAEEVGEILRAALPEESLARIHLFDMGDRL
jgi:ribonuclease Z